MLDEMQLHSLTSYLRMGAADASLALSRWLGRNAVISVERVDQFPLDQAAGLLPESEEPVAACIMSMQGHITGQLIMMFDDASGFMLADLLLDNPPGTASEWTEVELSAALETANIIGCAYLNSLARLFHDRQLTHEILPSPPKFHRDFAESLLEFALMNQAMASDTVFLTETAFSIEGTPANWTLLFVPDAPSIPKIESILKV